MIEAKGHNGQLRFDGRNITISRKGVLGFLTQGLKGDKVIQLSSVTAVQFKKVGMVTSGYLQLSLLGGGEAKGGVFDATQDENTVMFIKKQEADFQVMRDAIQAALDAPATRTPYISPAPHSMIDQLERLAALFENGLITEAEFAAQKSRLLS